MIQKILLKLLFKTHEVRLGSLMCGDIVLHQGELWRIINPMKGGKLAAKVGDDHVSACLGVGMYRTVLGLRF